MERERDSDCRERGEREREREIVERERERGRGKGGRTAVGVLKEYLPLVDWLVMDTQIVDTPWIFLKLLLQPSVSGERPSAENRMI